MKKINISVFILFYFHNNYPGEVNLRNNQHFNALVNHVNSNEILSSALQKNMSVSTILYLTTEAYERIWQKPEQQQIDENSSDQEDEQQASGIISQKVTNNKVLVFAHSELNECIQGLFNDALSWIEKTTYFNPTCNNQTCYNNLKQNYENDTIIDNFYQWCIQNKEGGDDYSFNEYQYVNSQIIQMYILSFCNNNMHLIRDGNDSVCLFLKKMTFDIIPIAYIHRFNPDHDKATDNRLIISSEVVLDQITKSTHISLNDLSKPFYNQQFVTLYECFTCETASDYRPIRLLHMFNKYKKIYEQIKSSSTVGKKEISCQVVFDEQVSSLSSSLEYMPELPPTIGCGFRQNLLYPFKLLNFEQACWTILQKINNQPNHKKEVSLYIGTRFWWKYIAAFKLCKAYVDKHDTVNYVAEKTFMGLVMAMVFIFYVPVLVAENLIGFFIDIIRNAAS